MKSFLPKLQRLPNVMSTLNCRIKTCQHARFFSGFLTASGSAFPELFRPDSGRDVSVNSTFSNKFTCANGKAQR